MGTQQFCLKWNNHSSNMLDAFGHLLSSEALVDVTLACADASMKAHKLVLSACSSFFQNLFLENPCTHPIIILHDLSYADLRALLEFMYNGEVNVSQCQLSTLLKVAETLKVKGLGDFLNEQKQQNSSLKSSQDVPAEEPLNTNTLQANTPVEKSSTSSDHEGETFNESPNSTDGNRLELSSEKDETNMVVEPSEEKPKLNFLCKSEDGETKSQEGYLGDKIQNISITSSDSTATASCNDEQFDVEPCCLMEQSMTTEKVFLKDMMPQEKSNMICFTSKNETSLTSLDNINSENFLSKELQDNSFSPYQTVQVGMLSITELDDPSNMPKRGRKPGSRLCVLCKHIFNCESDLEQHMQSHRDGTVCNIVEPTVPLTLATPDPQSVSEDNLVRLPQPCSVCNYMLNTMSDAQSHLTMNPICRTSQFKCPLCPKIFIWPATLTKHFREQHLGPEGTARVTQRLWFFCDICKKPLLSKHALSLHKSKFHGSHPSSLLVNQKSDSFNSCKRGRKQGTRVCRQCKRTFTSTTDFHQHIQTAHKGETPLQCTEELSLVGADESSFSGMSSVENESNSAQGSIKGD